MADLRLVKEIYNPDDYYGMKVAGYMGLFILLVLFMNWTVGKQATFYFLMLILVGQLVLNSKFFVELLK